MLNRKKLKSLVTPILIILFGVICFIFYQTLYQYHFYYQEQNQLFLLSSEYVGHYASQPAILACLIGDFLTQFYYYRYAGPAILSVCLVLLALAVWRSLVKTGMRRGSGVVAMIIMIVFAAFTLHYDYRLSSVIAALGGASLFYCAMSIAKLTKRNVIRWLLILLFLFLTYVLFGSGWILYALLMVIAFAFGRQWKELVCAIGCSLLAVMLIAITKNIYYRDVPELLTYPGTFKIVKPQLELDREFGVETEYRLGNWNRVLQMVDDDSNPTEGELFFYNLVNAQRGQLPYVLLKYPNNYLGTFEKIGPDTPLLTVKRINELYWALGDMTFAERAALQACVFSPDNRNVGMIKRLAEVNIVSGDTRAAEKYLRLLDKTFVYSGWSKTAKQSPVYRAKAQMSNRKDTLRTTDNTHLIMMELLDSNPHNTVALDYLLCSDLMLKDIANFKRDYDRYCIRTGNERITPLYQQALMIWLAGSNAKPEVWRRYIKLGDQTTRFAQYNAMRGNPQFSDTYWYWFDNH